MSEPARPTPLQEPATELAMRRTGMAFQRTRMSADRTLMAEIRTSLALITFGFTIFEAFQKLGETRAVNRLAGVRNFSITLVLLGTCLVTFGIVYHVLFMLELRRERGNLRSQGLIYAHSKFPASLTLIVACLLLLIGLIAAGGMIWSAGPYG